MRRRSHARQRLLDAGNQFVRAERLRQKRGNAELFGARPGAGSPHAERNTMGTSAVSGCHVGCGSGKAVERRHEQIEEDEVGLERVRQLDGVGAGHGDGNHVAAAAQEGCANLGMIELVVDDEHTWYSVVRNGWCDPSSRHQSKPHTAGLRRRARASGGHPGRQRVGAQTTPRPQRTHHGEGPAEERSQDHQEAHTRAMIKIRT